MTEQTKAQRLAEYLERDCQMNWPDYDNQMAAAAELRRLDALVGELVAVVELARTSHGRMLMSDPPQEAWKYNRVDDAIREVLAKAKEQT